MNEHSTIMQRCVVVTYRDGGMVVFYVGAERAHEFAKDFVGSIVVKSVHVTDAQPIGSVNYGADKALYVTPDNY